MEPVGSTPPSRLHSILPANPCPGWPTIWRLSRRRAALTTAVHRVVVDGLTPEQAADEAIARIKQLLSE